MVHTTITELFLWIVGFSVILTIPVYWVLYTTWKTKQEFSKEKSQKIRENFNRQMGEIAGYETGYRKGYADAINGLRNEFWYRDQEETKNDCVK